MKTVEFPWGPTDVCGVWLHPTTGKRHAVIGSDIHGYRLACRPNTPRPDISADVLDYRCTALVDTCWNEACWRHMQNPEGQ